MEILSVRLEEFAIHIAYKSALLVSFFDMARPEEKRSIVRDKRGAESPPQNQPQIMTATPIPYRLNF